MQKEQRQFEFMTKVALLSPDEIFKNATQELIESLKEDRRLERKPAGIHGKAIGDYFSVWSNTVPDGALSSSALRMMGRSRDYRISAKTG